MFTHQNPSVWADLGMILWAAGLKATAAWTISTETEAAGLKKGNYVQGTVCLVLRKRTADEPGFLDEVYPLVEDEVKRQIASMQALDEDGEPNFNDADYQLAAYAAALKVLTQYGTLDGRTSNMKCLPCGPGTRRATFRQSSNALSVLPATCLSREAWRIHGVIFPLWNGTTCEPLTLRAGVSAEKACMKNWPVDLASTDINGPFSRATRPTAPACIPQAVLPVQGLSTRRRDYEWTPFSPRSCRYRNASSLCIVTTTPFVIRYQGDEHNKQQSGAWPTIPAGHFWPRILGLPRRFIALLEWLAALGNAESMNEWSTDSEAARILAGRLRNDHV